MESMDSMNGMVVGWKQPSHPGLLHVRVPAGNPGRGSSAISLISLPAGALFAKMTSATACETRTWTSVQYHRDGSSIELNSEIVFCNHSCHPSLVFDMSKFEVRVADNRALKAGDALTFFYPSTEWDMQEPFTCECSEHDGDRCGRRIAGAKHASATLLNQCWLNEHIKDLLSARR